MTISHKGDNTPFLDLLIQFAKMLFSAIGLDDLSEKLVQVMRL
jgi:hypothetical protein